MGSLNKPDNGLNLIVWNTVLDADPVTITDQPQLYFKADGLYYKDGSGSVTGPLSTGGTEMIVAAADPGVSDDTYTVGQMWRSSITNMVWVLFDNTPDAADWKSFSSAVWSGSRPIPGVDGIATGLPKGAWWFWDGEKVGFMQTDNNFWTPITPYFSDHDPGVFNDEAHGFYKGMRWLNVPGQKEWLLWDQTNDNAAWKRVGSDAGSVIQKRVTDYIGTAAYRTKLARLEGGGVNAGDTTVLMDVGGSGTVLAIWSAASAGEDTKDLILRVFVDGEVDPAVELDYASLGLMHLDTDSEFWTQHTRAQYVVDGGGLVSWTLNYPMPYSSGCRVEVYNPTLGNCGLFGQVFYTEDMTDPRRLRSKGKTRLAPQHITDGDPPYEFLNTSGAPGTIVFHSIGIDGAATNGYLESDMAVYVDGEGAPSIASTGTEDWFQSAWYYGDRARSTPIANTSFIDLTSTHKSMQAVDLLELMGGIHFTDSVIFQVDLSETDTDFDLSYLVLYYEGDALSTQAFGPVYSEEATSTPPTLAELQAAFPDDPDVPYLQVYLNIGGLGTDYYLCTRSDGTWTYSVQTVAA